VKGKPVVPRRRAVQDVDQAIAWYLDQGSPKVALGFIAALERAYLQIGRHPAAGSPRYAQELGLPGLRCWPLARHPQLVFYVERSHHVDVWRVLHGKRDVPKWMSPAEET
jgi:toxin ParE1/3/4